MITLLSCCLRRCYIDTPYIRLYLITHTHYLLTPWSRVLLEELTGSQLVKKFPAFYGTRRGHYHINERPSPVPILSQLDPVHAPTFNFLKNHPNIIISSTSGSFKWFLSLRIFHQNPIYALSLPIRAICPTSHFRFDHPNNIGRARARKQTYTHTHTHTHTHKHTVESLMNSHLLCADFVNSVTNLSFPKF